MHHIVRVNRQANAGLQAPAAASAAWRAALHRADELDQASALISRIPDSLISFHGFCREFERSGARYGALIT
jgi:hypothetical protein